MAKRVIEWICDLMAHYSKLILAPWFTCIRMHIVIRERRGENARGWLPVTCQRRSVSLVSINPRLLASGHGGNVQWRTPACPLSLSCLLISLPAADSPRPLGPACEVQPISSSGSLLPPKARRGESACSGRTWWSPAGFLKAFSKMQCTASCGYFS